jgi:phage regulator Rha-like protein
MDDQFVRFSEIEEELAKTKETLEAELKTNAGLKENYEELSNLANERLAELISSQRAYQKMQVRAKIVEMFYIEGGFLR